MVLRPYVLSVEFGDGTRQTIDLEPVLAGELFGPLRDPALFGKAQVDPEAQTVLWPNGADLDPATLHDWPEHSAAFAELARRWRENAQDSATPLTNRPSAIR